MALLFGKLVAVQELSILLQRFAHLVRELDELEEARLSILLQRFLPSAPGSPADPRAFNSLAEIRGEVSLSAPRRAARFQFSCRDS